MPNYVSGINITKDIILDESNIFENCYKYIQYNNKIFKLDSRNPIIQKKITYKCLNKYKIKGNPNTEKYFCDGTLIAIRDEKNLKEYKFFFNKKSFFNLS